MIIKAFSTLSVMELPPRETAALFAGYGFDAVEIRLDGDLRFGGLGKEDASQIISLFGRGAVLSLNTGITLTPGYEPDQTLSDVVSFAEECAAPGIRFFADPMGDFDSLAAVCRRVGQFLRGVDPLIETHGVLSSSRDVRRLYDVSGGSFRVIWDVLHTAEAGEDPEESAENLRGTISHVHLKDARREENGYVMTPLGEGVIDPSRIRELLEGTGFSGGLSLEWEGFWRPELRGIYKSPDELMQAYLEWIK